MLYEDDMPCEWFSVAWCEQDFPRQQIQLGNPKYQTFFELLVLLLAVDKWNIVGFTLAVLGDNTGEVKLFP